VKEKQSKTPTEDLYKTQALYTSISQPLDRGPVPGPGINYTGPRMVLLEFVISGF